jgi:hypothetical protein
MRGETLASLDAHSREPTSTPSAPSISAAARPRPSAMPPAAHSNVAGDLAAMRSATSGTSVIVARRSPWPPASEPCATTTSAPQSIACSASRRVCTWQMSLAPEALMRAANGCGLPNDGKMARGLRARTRSTSCGCFFSAQVMKPQPTAALPAARNSASSQSLSP